MLVEDLFRNIDDLLGLEKLSLFSFLLMSSIIMFILTSIILYKARITSSHRSIGELFSATRQRISTLFILVFHTLSLTLLFIGLVSSLISLYPNTILITGLCTYVLNLALIASAGKDLSARRVNIFLFFGTTMLFAFWFSSKPVLNGIDAVETTTDTLQIYYEGFFRFSRHAGWYDLAPVDAITKNVLLQILGVGNPYDPITTTMIFTALALSLIVAIFSVVRKFAGDNEFISKSALALMVLAMSPYTALIGMSTPPTNYSLVLALLALVTISKSLANTNISSTIGAFLILTTTATLAHPMSLIVPIYLLSLMLIRGLAIPRIQILTPFLLSSIVYTLKALYTAAVYGFSGFLHIFYNSFQYILSIISSMHKLEIRVFLDSPITPPKSSLWSFGASVGFLSAIIVVELLIYLKKKKSDSVTIAVMLASLTLALAGAITNFFYPSSRYLSVPGFTLASFQAILYFLRNNFNKRWLRYLVVLLAVLCISSILSPNSMTEQYNVFTGGRWPRIENFILSKFIVEHVDLTYVKDVFVRHRSPALYLYFDHDIYLYGPPYHTINVLLVEKFLIPGLIDARSYWDFVGRGFVIYGGYTDSLHYTNKSIVFNGWKWVATWG